MPSHRTLRPNPVGLKPNLSPIYAGLEYHIYTTFYLGLHYSDPWLDLGE